MIVNIDQQHENHYIQHKTRQVTPIKSQSVIVTHSTRISTKTVILTILFQQIKVRSKSPTNTVIIGGPIRRSRTRN